MAFDTVRNLVNHRPDESTQAAMEQLRGYIHLTVDQIERLLPEGREKSLAFTKLEECTQWAMASLARGSFDTERKLRGQTADANADAGLDKPK